MHQWAWQGERPREPKLLGELRISGLAGTLVLPVLFLATFCPRFLRNQ